ncbi:MAG: serpin family protein [Gemmatimonadetes bacterium]|nr:serpin family protein [Gemmatimonadota bacterium]
MKGTHSVPQDVTSLVRGFNAFGLSLHTHLPREGNCFYSPLSIAIALSMLLPGAKGETLRELTTLLQTDADVDRLPERVAALIESLEWRASEFNWETDEAVQKDVFRLHLANALFAQTGYPVRQAYVDTLREHFSAALEILDFGQAEESADKINGWVSEQTRGMIPNLIGPHMISPEARVILVNAVYFFAEWRNQFSKRATTPQPFYLSGGTGGAVDVSMMRDEQHLSYGNHPELGLQSLEIPYQASMSMLVLLPAEGALQAVEEKLSADLLERLDAARTDTPIDLELPKFAITFQSPLRAIIESLGVRTAFDLENSEFTGISDHPDGLAIDEIIHEARVRVDEHGTEAAAATAELAMLGEPEEEPVVVPFIVNRPFLFVIRDRQTGAVLFVGRVEHPEE